MTNRDLIAPVELRRMASPLKVGRDLHEKALTLAETESKEIVNSQLNAHRAVRNA